MAIIISGMIIYLAFIVGKYILLFLNIAPSGGGSMTALQIDN
jgi:hypothetical protein